MSRPRFCRIDRCKERSWPTKVLVVAVDVFCQPHQHDFAQSHEGQRVTLLAMDRNPQHVLVAALHDFKTRLEREAASDRDPVIAQARARCSR